MLGDVRVVPVQQRSGVQLSQVDGDDVGTLARLQRAGEVVQPELDALDEVEDHKPVIGGLAVGDAN